MRTIKLFIERRYMGKHEYVKVSDLELIYNRLKEEIEHLILSEFIDGNNDKCISFNKRKLMTLIGKLNPK